LHPLLCKGDFFFGEVEGGADLWDVGQEEKGCYANRERDYAVDDEEPGYSGVSGDTWVGSNSRLLTIANL